MKLENEKAVDLDCVHSALSDSDGVQYLRYFVVTHLRADHIIPCFLVGGSPFDSASI